VLQGISAVRCLEWDVLLAVGDSEGLGLILIGCGLLLFSALVSFAGIPVAASSVCPEFVEFRSWSSSLGSHLSVTRLVWASVMGALVSFAGIPVFRVGSVS
jgi:hypothetical protein